MENWARCVICDRDQPEQGKILRCLHVICGTCLTESSELDGALKCRTCGHVSRPRRQQDDLAATLADYRPVIFQKGDDARSQGVEEVVYCDFCDPSSSAPVSHYCADCIPRPSFCRDHAETHLRPRVYRGHSLVELSKADIRSRRFEVRSYCPLHQLQERFFCQECKLVVCEICASKSHVSHAILNSEAGARLTCSRIRRILSHEESYASQLQVDEECFLVNPNPIAGKGLSLSEIDHSLAQVASAESDIAEQHAKLAGEVSEVMSLIQSMVTGRERELMAELTAMFSARREPLAEQKRRLQGVRDATSHCFRLASVVESSSLSDVDCIRLGSDIEDKLRESRTLLKSDMSPCVSGSVGIVVCNDVILGMQHMVTATASAACFVVDFEASLIHAPSMAMVDEESKVKMTLRTSGRRAVLLSEVPHFNATLYAPSGRTTQLVATLSRRNSCKYKLPFRPSEFGRHCLEVTDGKSTVKHYITVDIFEHCGVLGDNVQRPIDLGSPGSNAASEDEESAGPGAGSIEDSLRGRYSNPARNAPATVAPSPPLSEDAELPSNLCRLTSSSAYQPLALPGRYQAATGNDDPSDGAPSSSPPPPYSPPQPATEQQDGGFGTRSRSRTLPVGRGAERTRTGLFDDDDDDDIAWLS